MSMSAAACCCGQEACLYWCLVSCGDTGQPIDVPRYVYARCDVYELETGDSASNCPSDWVPNKYITWIQDPDPCELDPECGFFRCAANLLIAPTQITTSAVAQGLQTTPPLAVSDVCPADPVGPVSLASRSELLAWLEVDDCCSDECGNIPRGVGIPCHLLNSNACTVPITTIAALTQFRWFQPSGSASGTNAPFSGGWTGDVTVGPLPSSWTIVTNGGGVNNSSYELEFVVPWTVSYSVTVDCSMGTSGCFPSPTTQSFSISSTFTVRAQVSSVTGLNCNTKDLIVSATSATVGLQAANTTCQATTAYWVGGLGRSQANDIYCGHPFPAVMRYDSNNYTAFAFNIFQPDLLNYPPVCIDENFNTVNNPLGYLEMITPLGPPTDYC